MGVLLNRNARIMNPLLESTGMQIAMFCSKGCLFRFQLSVVTSGPAPRSHLLVVQAVSTSSSASNSDASSTSREAKMISNLDFSDDETCKDEVMVHFPPPCFLLDASDDVFYTPTIKATRIQS